MSDQLLNKEMKEELKEIEPGWKKAGYGKEAANHSDAGNAPDTELGLESTIPSNYENNLVKDPKDLTSFEVEKAPGRLG